MNNEYYIQNSNQTSGLPGFESLNPWQLHPRSNKQKARQQQQQQQMILRVVGHLRRPTPVVCWRTTPAWYLTRMWSSVSRRECCCVVCGWLVISVWVVTFTLCFPVLTATVTATTVNTIISNITIAIIYQCVWLYHSLTYIYFITYYTYFHNNLSLETWISFAYTLLTQLQIVYIFISVNMCL